MEEYSYPLVQTVEADENALFLNGSRCCRKGLILHNDSSGIFRMKAAGNTCKTVYKITFTANIAISAGGTVEPISVALTSSGEVQSNAVATVTPAAIGDFFNVSISTSVPVICGCCESIAIRNISNSAIDMINANLTIERKEQKCTN